MQQLSRSPLSIECSRKLHTAKGLGTISSRSRHQRPAVHRSSNLTGSSRVRRKALGPNSGSSSNSRSKDAGSSSRGKDASSSRGKDGGSSSRSREKWGEAVVAGYGWRQMVPGDSGWDLLKLRKSDVKTFNRFREVEVIHARWAMLGVISILLGDAVDGSPFPPQPLSVASAAPWGLVLLLSLGLIESYRLAALWDEDDFEKRTYPGRWFDFLGFTRPSQQPAAEQQEPPGLGLWASWVGGLPGWLAGGWWYSRREMTEVELLDMKSRELRNGRLAMVSFIGCCLASALTGKGPITLLCEHLGDPVHHTIVQTLQ
ncbi:chlorophyll a/b-binding protein domain-containing protein [Scenedesmus sp. NREL 46B-D3]|nr:chlorophyll a/b-binding protein domain-containing protein [Scenedesmus sp. NREL 46B-D3]